MKNFITLVLLLFLFSCTYTNNVGNESYTAGFKIVRTIDKTRIYKPGTDTTDYLHYRPLDIDLWYPSTVNENDSVLEFRDILGLLEKRAVYYTGSQEWHGITRQIAQSFCDGIKCSDSTRLLNFMTRSVRNAPPAGKKFPLVIYICAFNGMSFENFPLFEILARRGFVVMSINSIGRFPGDMTMKKEDLFEQVNDAIASFKSINHSSNIDFSKIGIIGYSWGGLSGAFAAGSIPDVACLVSFDGSEFHHYGQSEKEDSDFNGIRYSPEFINLKLPMPYLRLESSPGIGSSKTDSIYNFSEKLTGQKQIFVIDSAKHEDFSCLSVVVRESGNCPGNECYNVILKLTLSFLEDHLKNTNTFAQTIDQEINKTITK